jgi:hypothetical protein
VTGDTPPSAGQEKRPSHGSSSYVQAVKSSLKVSHHRWWSSGNGNHCGEAGQIDGECEEAD